MKMLKALPRMAFAALIACASTVALAAPADPPTFEDLFKPLETGACVTMASVRAAGAAVELTPEQFQFVRAFWMAIPPLSHDLPPGDKAFIAKDRTGDIVAGLVDSATGDVCATFRAIDWIQKLIDAIGRGETGHKGDPT